MKTSKSILTPEDVKLHEESGGDVKVKSTKGKKKGEKTKEIIITRAYAEAEVKAALIAQQFGKCVYCESRIRQVSSGEVEHFRPKAKYKGPEWLPQSGLGYFWLAYEWTNLFLACEVCNRSQKGTFFGILPEIELLVPFSERMEVGDEDTKKEMPFLVDPGAENPRLAFRFAKDGKVTSADIENKNNESKTLVSRALTMIDQLGLNRPELVVARLRHVAFLSTLYELALGWLYGDSQAQGLYVKLLGKVSGLRREADFKKALEIQGEVFKLYESIRGKLSHTSEEEAFKWLVFAVTPKAEYSALAQDCLLSWSLEKGAIKELSGTLYAPERRSQGKEVTSNTKGIVGSIPRVAVFEAAIDSSLDDYKKNADSHLKKVEGGVEEEVRKAKFENYANELNNIIDEFNGLVERWKGKRIAAEWWFDELDRLHFEVRECTSEIRALKTGKGVQECDRFMEHLKSARDKYLPAVQSGLAISVQECWEKYKEKLDNDSLLELQGNVLGLSNDIKAIKCDKWLLRNVEVLQEALQKRVAGKGVDDIKVAKGTPQGAWASRIRVRSIPLPFDGRVDSCLEAVRKYARELSGKKKKPKKIQLKKLARLDHAAKRLRDMFAEIEKAELADKEEGILRDPM